MECRGPEVCDRRHLHDLEVLQELARVLTLRRASEEKIMLRDLLSTLNRHRGVLRSTLMMLDTNGNELRLEATGECAADAKDDVRYRRGEGITGRVLETGKSIAVPVVAHDSRFQGRIYRRDQKTHEQIGFICAPVKIGDDVLGTLSIDLETDAACSIEEAERFLNIVSAMIANDVRNRRIIRMEREALEAENLRLRSELMPTFRPENMIGNSHEMRDVFLKIQKVAAANTTVLICGESGTGKELVAAAIHYNSPRANEPFIKVNCAALNENLLESELFGHEKGAFTGALYMRTGRLEEADGGTLFLDEIGEFSPSIQVKLLRVIQERTYERVGSNITRKSNVRIIAATNVDLAEAVRKGEFREDLYYRIHVFPLMLPPLRNRRGDLLLLANHFVSEFARRMGREVNRISTSAINMLLAYHWPGNVRELENCIEHAVLVSTDGVIHGHDLPPTLQVPGKAPDPGTAGTLKARVAILEKDLIIDALKRHKGNISEASAELGITGRMVRYKIKNLNIDYKRLFGGKRRKDRADQ